MYKTPNKRRIYTSLLIIPIFILLTVLVTRRKVVYAAKFTDGTWTQSASPGTTTVNFTNSGGLVAGDDIVLSFPATADVDATGTNITCTDQGTPIRTNNDSANTITITLDAPISGSTAITIAMTDGLTSYTTTTYAIDSVGINTQDNSDELIDFGLALLTNTNANETIVTASVPLFTNMAIDTTTIDLGTLSTASVAEADQTYTFNSNNTTGITVQIATDGTLTDGSNDIDYVSDGTVSAGSEEYGIEIDNTTAGLIIDSDYAPNDNDIIQAANNIAVSQSNVSSATFDINYKASIDGSTVAGDYEQTITVTVSTNA